MACTPFQALAFATEHLSQDLYYRSLPRGIMMNLVPRDEYPMDAGFVITNYIMERLAPDADEETWLAITQGSPYTGTCGDTWNDVTPGYTAQTYTPEQFDLRGPVFCQDDMIFGHMPDRFIEGYLEGLTKRSQMSLENRLLKQYYTLSDKSVANASYSDLGTPATLPKAASALTQSMLDQTAVELNQEGANNPDDNGWIMLGQDGPVYPLYIGQYASNDIALNNTDFRADNRYAFEGMGTEAITLKRLGASKVIKNFRHIINIAPPRFTYDSINSVYVRVNTWIASNATSGKKYSFNPSWLSIALAPYELALVLNPFVIKERIVRPVNSVGSLTWEYKSYMGEWIWQTGGREICDDSTTYDPVKKLGRHFAMYKHAIEPIIPTYGRAIFFERCGGVIAQDTCS